MRAISADGMDLAQAVDEQHLTLYDAFHLGLLHLSMVEAIEGREAFQFVLLCHGEAGDGYREHS